ncbi:DUF4163 domain-containing protein [Arenibacter sp. GZD96]|uniref:DUF3298 and DUF4163 domain-containing protein n=1 Tax=Aurantibrevibacter litoralis TaxID=3106030 RepID=UPI002AFEE23A|nr:DUF4163 domain-containing protein [Arenibacter sp. GZD-96]MEA1786570.1 DUF4163 domain-containing protein [Arenibacter sp. GZD-96]
MKYLGIFILIVGLLASCGSDEKKQLSFTTKTYQTEPCQHCPSIFIEMPQVVEDSELGNLINEAVTQAVILELIYDDSLGIRTPEEAMASFKNGFLELKKMYPDESLGWEAQIVSTPSYEDQNVLSIKIDAYLFTGGAHGQSTTRFLNFDKKKGVQLSTWELFKESEGFLSYVEQKFRLQEGIPAGASINSTGFMFEEATFYLPETIGYTKKGIQLIYEQYEIASYADGPVSLVLPYKEVQPYLSLPLVQE